MRAIILSVLVFFVPVVNAESPVPEVIDSPREVSWTSEGNMISSYFHPQNCTSVVVEVSMYAGPEGIIGDMYLKAADGKMIGYRRAELKIGDGYSVWIYKYEDVHENGQWYRYVINSEQISRDLSRRNEALSEYDEGCIADWMKPIH